MKKKRCNKEAVFQTDLSHGFDHYINSNGIRYAIWKKIADLGETNPYDSYCMFLGRFYAMEQKVNRDITGFNFKKLFKEREHQLSALKRVENCGFEGWVTVSHWVKNRINKAYAMKIDVAQKLWEGPTISIEEFVDTDGVIELKKTKNNINQSVWDLSVIFE